MAFFRRKKEAAASPVKPSSERILVARDSYCRICKDLRKFTRCWQRVGMMSTCPCCGLAFEEPRALYAKNQPMCPRCSEFLEQPGFEYGLCDGCGTKYELVEGARPGFMPNKEQRAEMEQYGRSRSIE